MGFPDRFAEEGYPNPTNAYTRPDGYDGDGRPVVWVNPGEGEGPDERGYYARVDAADRLKLQRHAWFFRPEGFPRRFWSAVRTRGGS